MDIFIRVHTRHVDNRNAGRDLEKITNVKSSVQMTVMKQRIRTPDAGKGTTYRLIYSKNSFLLILIDIYPKNMQEKPSLDVINKHMANVHKDSSALPEPFIEIYGESCGSLPYRRSSE